MRTSSVLPCRGPQLLPLRSGLGQGGVQVIHSLLGDQKLLSPLLSTFGRVVIRLERHLDKKAQLHAPTPCATPTLLAAAF